jgi:hypothetical protein
MKKEFIPYEQALALKELGFTKNGFGWYNNERSALSIGDLWRSSENAIIAPTFSQCFRWFREKYYLHPLIEQTQVDYRCSIVERPRIFYHIDNIFDTYEEAELECLKKLIEIIKEKKL